MKRTLFLFTIIGLCFVLLPGAASAKKDSIPIHFDQSEPLNGVEEVEVYIEMGLAEFEVRPMDGDQLVRVTGSYAEAWGEPRLEVDRRGDFAEVRFIADDIKEDELHDDMDVAFVMEINRGVLLDLNMELGLGENTVDLSGMRVQELNLESGLSETTILLNEANPVRCEEASIESGLGELVTENLGLLRFDSLEIEGGLGEVELDLRGFEGEGTVDMSIGLGSGIVIIPANLGVALEYEDSFLSDVNLDRFERQRKGSYHSEGYDQAEHHVALELSVGLGSLEFDWR